MSNTDFPFLPVHLQHGRHRAADSKERIKADSAAQHHHRENLSPAKYEMCIRDRSLS